MNKNRLAAALSAIATMASLVIAVPAPAQSTAPALQEPWTRCADSSTAESPSPGRTDYCIR
ncbi:MAG: hypothetical protein M3161_00790, partial [Actinomycetota bacterium]|nr:hypothetical protein [Actinomycetota bacterium]